jgi:hypothetical protein
VRYSTGRAEQLTVCTLHKNRIQRISTIKGTIIRTSNISSQLTLLAEIHKLLSNYDHISVTIDKESLTTTTDFSSHKLIGYGASDGKKDSKSKSYIVADSEIIYQCSMTEKNTGARRKARIKVSMENVYTDEYPDGIITCLLFTNVDQQNENLSPVSE